MEKETKKIKSCIMDEQPQLVNEVIVDGQVIAVIKNLDAIDGLRYKRFMKSIALANGVNTIQEVESIIDDLDIAEWLVLNLILSWASDKQFTLRNLQTFHPLYVEKILLKLFYTISNGGLQMLAIEKN